MSSSFSIPSFRNGGSENNSSASSPLSNVASSFGSKSKMRLQQFSKSLKNLELDKKVVKSKENLQERIKKMEISEKVSNSKTTISEKVSSSGTALKKSVQNLELDKKIAKGGSSIQNSFKNLELSQKYSNSKSALSSSVQNSKSAISNSVQKLEINKKLEKRKESIQTGIKNFELNQKMAKGKETFQKGIEKMELSEKFSNSKTALSNQMEKMELNKKLANTKETVGGALSKLYSPKNNNGSNEVSLKDDLFLFDKEKKEDEKAENLVRESEERCLETIEKHLSEFIEKNPNAAYEEWIQDLHPENCYGEDSQFTGIDLDDDSGNNNISSPSDTERKVLDHRFYIEDSDHRRLWNERCYENTDDNQIPMRKEIPARSLESLIADATYTHLKLFENNETNDSEQITDIPLF